MPVWQIKIIYTSLTVMAVSAAISIVNPSSFFAYVLIVPFIAGFAVFYPTIVTLFSQSVDESEQGWIMGVTVALFTLGAGLISLIGGQLMSINIHLPFIITLASLALALLLTFALWRGDAIRQLVRS